MQTKNSETLENAGCFLFSDVSKVSAGPGSTYQLFFIQTNLCQKKIIYKEREESQRGRPGGVVVSTAAPQKEEPGPLSVWTVQLIKTLEKILTLYLMFRNSQQE